MTHPEELLADYVDGSLGDVARAGVDAHLTECAQCRDEIGWARSARAALQGLPQVEAPMGVASQALREAAGSHSKADGPPRYARILPIAAAAVLVGLLAIALPRLGQDSTPSATAESGTTEAAGDNVGPRASGVSGSTADLARLAETGVRVEKQQVDYDDVALRALVDETAARWQDVRFPADVAFGGQNAPEAGLATDEARAAADCVYTDVPEEDPAIIVRLIEATYQGEPAFLAVVLEGTEAGKPAVRAVVWIVRKDDCALKGVAEQLLLEP